MVNNRIGKIEIHRTLIEESTGLFQCFNPIHIEIEKYEILTYTCYSELFDVVKEGGKIPKYDITVTRHELGGSVYHTFEVDKYDK